MRYLLPTLLLLFSCNKNYPVPPSMVFIKGGTYTMGDLFGEGESRETQHSVTVSDFYLGKTEVTFDDFDAFCNATGRTKPSDSGWGRGNRPVIEVSWLDAAEYCNWLSQQQKRTPAYTIKGDTVTLNPFPVGKGRGSAGYRLPTEAEWEYAARSGGKYSLPMS
jgi:formylglycine-generating enzyme